MGGWRGVWVVASPLEARTTGNERAIATANIQKGAHTAGPGSGSDAAEKTEAPLRAVNDLFFWLVKRNLGTLVHTHE